MIYSISCYVRFKNLGHCQIRPFETELIIPFEKNCCNCLYLMMLIVWSANKTSDAKNLVKSQIMSVTYSFTKPYGTLQNPLLCSTQLITQISQTFQKLLSLRGIEKLKKIPIKSFKAARRGNVTYGFSSSISNLWPLLKNKATV